MGHVSPVVVGKAQEDRGLSINTNVVISKLSVYQIEIAMHKLLQCIVEVDKECDKYILCQ